MLILSLTFQPEHNKKKKVFHSFLVYLRRKEQPSVRRALPPVGWQRTVEQPAQMTTVWACEKTVVMVKQPGHLTSMKKERGWGTRVCRRRDSMISHHCSSNISIFKKKKIPCRSVPFPICSMSSIGVPGPGRISRFSPLVGLIFSHLISCFFRR